MKKLMAIALALVMMLAVMVPAFAATGSWMNPNPAYDGSDPSIDPEIPAANGGKTDIITSTDKADGTEGAWYVVTIPASQTIYWGEESTEILYEIKSQLGPKTGVHVTVADEDGAYEMTDKVNTDLAPLPYTLAGQTDVTTQNPVMPNGQYAVQVQVDAADWDAAVVSEYTDTLLFTASTAAIA